MNWTAEEVRKLREQADLSMNQLAMLIDTDLNIVSRWERGLHRVSDRLAPTLNQVQKAIGEQYLPWRTAMGWDGDGNPVAYRCRQAKGLLIVQTGKIAKTKRGLSLFVPTSEVRSNYEALIGVLTDSK